MLLILGELTFLFAALYARPLFGEGSKGGSSIDPESGEGDAGGTDKGASSVNKYTVTWLNYDGSVLEVDQYLDKGDTPQYDGETPKKDAEGLVHYTFKGWNHEVVAVDKDATYVATYSVGYNDATVVFDLNGHGTAIEPQEVSYNDYIIKPTDPTTKGYTFGGWYKDPSCTTAWNFASDKVTNDVTVYAKWNVNYYTVSFDVNNDHSTETRDSLVLPYGSLITKPSDPADIIYSEYSYDEFVCWVDVDDHVWDFDHDTVDGDITLYGRWDQFR